MRGGGALRESRSRREARVVDVDEGRSATDDGVSVDHGASPVVVLSGKLVSSNACWDGSDSPTGPAAHGRLGGCTFLSLVGTGPRSAAVRGTPQAAGSPARMFCTA